MSSFISEDNIFFTDDYDRCYECSAYGDDYYFDDNGDLVCACDECWYNEYRDDYDD